MYTDGSKIESSKSLGAACFCPDLNISIRKAINQTGSVYTAECFALSNALDIALKNIHQNYVIFSDSLSALQSLQSVKHAPTTNPHIYEIKRKYNEYLVNNIGYSIRFFWIPSHIGIVGNKTAGRIAKMTTAIDEDDTAIIPFTDYYEQFRKNMKTQIETFLKETGQTKGKEYVTLYYSNYQKPWYTNSHLNRRSIVTINRCRANHYNLAASLARIRIVDNPMCACNESEENLNHVLWECNRYDAERLYLKEELKKIKLCLPLNIEKLIKSQM